MNWYANISNSRNTTKEATKKKDNSQRSVRLINFHRLTRLSTLLGFALNWNITIRSVCWVICYTKEGVSARSFLLIFHFHIKWRRWKKEPKIIFLGIFFFSVYQTTKQQKHTHTRVYISPHTALSYTHHHHPPPPLYNTIRTYFTYRFSTLSMKVKDTRVSI